MTIYEIRIKTGLSQSQFAKYLNIPVSTIQHWEQGVRMPREYVVELIERLLKAEGIID